MKKLLLSIFLLTVTSAWAHPDWTTNPPESAQTQLEINQWAAQEYEDADAELNRVWNELIPTLSQGEKDSLTEAQLIWIKFRDANAKAAQAAYEGGSMAPFAFAQSRTQTTRMRTFQLRERLDELVRLGN